MRFFNTKSTFDRNFVNQKASYAIVQKFKRFNAGSVNGVAIDDMT